METTLCLLKKDNSILLAMKKRGFGSGKYNGIGGKIEKGETPDEAMIRETKEEIKVTPIKYEKVGIINFDEYYKGNKEHVTLHLYMVYEWKGNPSESEEMNPKWFDIKKLPFNQMLPDDKYWLPLVLDGKKIKGQGVTTALLVKNGIEVFSEKEITIGRLEELMAEDIKN